MPIQLDALEQAKSTLIDLAIKFGRGAGGHFDSDCRFLCGKVGWKSSQPLASQVRSRAARTFAAVRIAGLLVGGIFIIMALQNLGVELLPLIAGLGVAGAGIALAMQGVLGNLAAGLTIIFTRPFRVGEYVALSGV
jgi:small conductance mechanosensitive channel